MLGPTGFEGPRRRGCWRQEDPSWLNPVLQRQLARVRAAHERGDRDGGLSQLQILIEDAPRDLAVSIEVARSLIETFADPERAERVLVDFESSCEVGRVLTATWISLASGWQVLLGDDEAVRRCLAAATQQAQESPTVDDLLSLAEATDQLLGDHASAAEWLRKAEVLAGGCAKSMRHVVGAWKDLGDGHAVSRCMRLLEDVATTVEDDFLLAFATREIGGGDARVREVLSRAGNAAVTSTELVRVGEAFREMLGDTGEARTMLESASQLAEGFAERAWVATAWRNWFRDEGAAVRVGHVRGRPAELLDAEGVQPLFGRLCDAVTEGDLRAIANADYGQGAEEHFVLFQQVVATGEVTLPLLPGPLEVCELYRWSGEEQAGHAARAFCCVLLLLHDLAHELVDGSSTTWALLLMSCRALGEDTLLDLHEFARSTSRRHDPLLGHPQRVLDRPLDRFAAFVALLSLRDPDPEQLVLAEAEIMDEGEMSQSPEALVEDLASWGPGARHWRRILRNLLKTPWMVQHPESPTLRYRRAIEEFCSA